MWERKWLHAPIRGEKENACTNEGEKGVACTNEREKMRPNQLIPWAKIFKNCDLQTRTEGVFFSL
jgi:hypothetical protein